VILRPLRPADADQALAAHAVMAREGFPFLLSDPPAPGSARLDAEWPAFLARVERERRGQGLPPGWVRATFLVAEVEGQIVGRVSIRHELTEALRRLGGHVGYGVLPEHRGRGYATVMLRAALGLLGSDGVDEALVTCEDANAASAAVVERCGGRLVQRLEVDGRLTRHYLVPTAAFTRE